MLPQTQEDSQYYSQINVLKSCLKVIYPLCSLLAIVARYGAVQLYID